jgi:hypothetical protein
MTNTKQQEEEPEWYRFTGFTGAGQHIFWRRWTAFLAQVFFLG